MPREHFISPTSPISVFLAEIPEMSGSAWLSGELARLDQASLAKARRISHPRRRMQFLLGRALLGRAMNHLFGDDASNWKLGTGAGGKPVLFDMAEGGAVPAVSLAHSASVVVCAMAERETLGVDVEYCKPRNFPALSGLVMTPAEREYMDNLPTEQQTGFFYRCWTLKEAIAKASGAENAPAFDRIDAGLCKSGQLAEPGKPEFQTALVSIDNMHFAALAYSGEPGRIATFHLASDGAICPINLAGGWRSV